MIDNDELRKHTPRKIDTGNASAWFGLIVFSGAVIWAIIKWIM